MCASPHSIKKEWVKNYSRRKEYNVLLQSYIEEHAVLLTVHLEAREDIHSKDSDIVSLRTGHE